MYDGASTRVKSMCGETEDFRVNVGVHQISALSFYLLFLVIDEIIKVIQGDVTLLYAEVHAVCIFLIEHSTEEIHFGLEK